MLPLGSNFMTLGERRVVLEICPPCPSAALLMSQTCLQIEMERWNTFSLLKLAVVAVRNLLLSANTF